MILDKLQILRDAGHEEIAKTMCIQYFLNEKLDREPICTEDAKLDLNPQLILKHACEQVALQVQTQKFTCTTEDVMLVWLTSAVYLGQHVCNVT